MQKTKKNISIFKYEQATPERPSSWNLDIVCGDQVSFEAPASKDSLSFLEVFMFRRVVVFGSTSDIHFI